jgi:hypothetical protein
MMIRGVVMSGQRDSVVLVTRAVFQLASTKTSQANIFWVPGGFMSLPQIFASAFSENERLILHRFRR